MENELNRLVDAVPGFVWTTLPDGRIDFLNRRWCEYTGLGAEEGHGHGWQRAIHPDDLPGLLGYWESMRAAGKPKEAKARVRRLDGEYRWFLFRACALTDAAGNFLKWCGINTDIHEQERAERDLRAIEVNFRQIVDSIPALVCTMNAAGVVEILNRPLLDFFGRTPAEMQGWANSDAVHPDDQARVIAAFTEAVTTGKPYDVEHRCRRSDGVYRWFQVRALPVRDADAGITGCTSFSPTSTTGSARRKPCGRASAISR